MTLPDIPPMGYLVIGLGVVWMFQMLLSTWQMKRFYARIAQLRRKGRVAIGKAGTAWRLRQYAVVVVNKQNTVVAVERLSGLTIFARLRPVEGLVGRPLEALIDDSVALPVSNKFRLALKDAAGYLLEDPATAANDPQSKLRAAMSTSLSR